MTEKIAAWLQVHWMWIGNKTQLITRCAGTTYYQNKTFTLYKKRIKNTLKMKDLSWKLHPQNNIRFCLSKCRKWQFWNTYAVDIFNMFKKSTASGGCFNPNWNQFDVHSYQMGVMGCVSLWVHLIPYWLYGRDTLLKSEFKHGM